MADIVEINRANIEQFVELYVTVFNAPPWNDGWSKEAALERLTTFTAFPRFLGLGGFDSGQAVSLVLGWGERGVRGWMFHIKELCVTPACQRSGLGGELMCALESKLIKQRFIGVYLQTGSRTPARQFYEHCGYRCFDVISLRKGLA